MQQPNSTRSQRTQPAIPGVTVSTEPVTAQRARGAFYLQATVTSGKQRAQVGRVFLSCLLCGVWIEAILLFLAPILANLSRPTDRLFAALSTALPWLSQLPWMQHLPVLLSLISAVPWLNPQTTIGNLNLFLTGLLLAIAGMAIAAVTSRKMAIERLTPFGELMLFGLLLLFTLLFSVTLFILPAGINQLSQNMPLYGFYGRMIVIYHVNPYAANAAASLIHDQLLALTGITHPGSAPYGPVWLDFCILVTLLAGKGIINVIIGFRLLGLCTHVGSSILLWLILKRFKPKMRLIGTLLYAWNPLVLLLSISWMQQEAVIVFGLLLAIFFLQRESPTLGWVCALLVALINPFYALLLPIIFRLLMRESRILYLQRRFLWWLGMICVTVLVVALAYAPYLQYNALAGIWSAFRQAFLPDTASNSLDAALLHLPVTLPPALLWLFAPHHWAAFVLVIGGLIMLLGLWLADTLALVLLFASWILLCGVVLPVYWPWYLLPVLALALASSHTRTLMLALLFLLGACISLYCLLWAVPMLGLSFITVGLPLLLWGWTIFFLSTWRMTHASVPELPREQKRALPSFSRPSWMSRPSRPGR